MKKNLKLIVFTAVLCAVSALNVKVVLDIEHFSDLAMTSLAAIGEGNSGEGGSGEGGSGESGGGQESNNHGSGKFFYEHLSGRPDRCTLYRYIGAGVSFTSTDDKLGANGQYTKTTVSGVEETCPGKNGNGCTVYSCQQTD
jgi:hypothetical protein